MKQPTRQLGSTLDRAAIDQLLDTCGEGGEEFVAILLGTFFEDAPHLLADLRRAILENNLDEARRAAHTLKSQGMTFGALFLAHVAREMETLTRDGNRIRAASLVDELEEEYRLARKDLDVLRDSLLEDSLAA